MDSQFYSQIASQCTDPKLLCWPETETVFNFLKHKDVAAKEVVRRI